MCTKLPAFLHEESKVKDKKGNYYKQQNGERPRKIEAYISINNNNNLDDA